MESQLITYFLQLLVSPVSLGVVSIVVSALAITWIFKRAHNKRLLSIFMLPTTYSVISWDIGKQSNKKKIWLNRNNVCGMPDALFLKRFSRKGVVGEVKSRRYTGKISDYERYQVTLYMGLFLSQFRLRHVYAIIRYKDRSVSVEFDSSLYKHLIELREEVRQSRDGWFPVDERSLSERRASYA